MTLFHKKLFTKNYYWRYSWSHYNKKNNRDERVTKINSYNKILDDYDTSVYTQESLHRLVEIYYSLGLIEEAKRYASTLGFNFPDSDWYTKSYELVKDLS